MKTTIIEIDQDILSTLESWHGGQWTAAYAVSSSIRGGNESALDKDTVGRAINEYEREYDYTKMSRKDKRELGYAIEVLKAYYDAMPDDGSESEYEGEEIEEMTVWEPSSKIDEIVNSLDGFSLEDLLSITQTVMQSWLESLPKNKIDSEYESFIGETSNGSKKYKIDRIVDSLDSYESFNDLLSVAQTTMRLWLKSLPKDQVDAEYITFVGEPAPKKRMKFDDAWLKDGEGKYLIIEVDNKNQYHVIGRRSKHLYHVGKNLANARKFISDMKAGRPVDYSPVENIGSIPEIRDWAIVFGDNDPWAAPETKMRMVTGLIFNHPTYEDGKEITTSYIDTVTGRSFSTRTGSMYKLVGKPNPAYMKWMKDNRIKYDSKNPIRVK